MRSLSRPIFLFFCITMTAASCQTIDSPTRPAVVSSRSPTPTLRGTAVLAPTPTAGDNTATPPAALSAAPTRLPPPSPTASPMPLARLAVPDEWVGQVNDLIADLNGRQEKWRWQSVATDDPRDLVESGRAEVAFVEDNTGIIFKQEPLALTVPFAIAWEGVSGSEAEIITTEGHELVTLMRWAEMPPARKALRIDGRLPHESGYPLQETWSLYSAQEYEQEAASLAAFLRERFAPEPLVHLAAVGDIMLDRGLGYAIRQGDLDYPFIKVADELRSPNIVLGNLESSLGDSGEPADKHYSFQSPPEAAISLAQAGFNVMNLANNHAMDYGPDALLQGISLLRDQGIATIGAGRDAAAAHTPAIQQVNGLSVALLGYVNVPVEVGGFDTQTWAAGESPGLAWGAPETIASDVSRTLLEADIVIVVLHSGLEYVEAPSDPQVAAARAAVDAGAHLVIGHHSHILQGIEFYQQGVIVYGLGNFAFQIEGDPESAILHAWLDKGGVRQLEISPVLVQYGGQPRPAEAWEAAAIRQRVYRLTNLLNPRPAASD